MTALPESYIWNAYLMVRNEESHISEVISRIKNQKPIPPENIFVTNDGSTDKTGDILNDISDLTVKHIIQHRPDVTSHRYRNEKTDLLKLAIKNADYAICVDGDTMLPENYVDRIINNMQNDGVFIACGRDERENELSIPDESPTVFNAAWMRSLQNDENSPPLDSTILQLVMYASFSGYRSAIYKTVEFQYIRRIAANMSPDIANAYGKSFRTNGFSLWYVLCRAILDKQLGYIVGYRSTKYTGNEKTCAWLKRFQYDYFFLRFGRIKKNNLLFETETVKYIMPFNRSEGKTSAFDVLKLLYYILCKLWMKRPYI